MALLTVQNLGFSYSGGHQVFDGLNLSVEKGEIVGILGPNGCGKSTLFGLLTMGLLPSAGEILFNGQSIAKTDFLKKLGCVFQSVSLDPILTVYENLYMQGVLHELSKSEIKTKIQALAKQFQFELNLDQRVKLLSGGYARRVEIAKAMIHEPSVILLDEPSTGLDPKSRLDLFGWLSNIGYAKETTVIWITHMTDEVQKMDRVIMMHEGSVICDGKPLELVNQLDHFYIHAKLKNFDVMESIEKIAFDVSLQGEKIEFRVPKQNLDEVLGILVPNVENLMYREPNLEDVYLEKTGVYFR